MKNDLEIFSELPYCLRQYVSNHHWSKFRKIQRDAFDLIVNEKSHLIISAGTSSGKTEAAMFPIIKRLSETKEDGISVLYISPLIALIDDQFERISEMTSDSDISVNSWHGEISYSKKKKIMNNGSGILQITPESLESIIHKHPEVVERMFRNLHYIVIDEVHVFMSSERGLHLQCEIEYLQRVINKNPIRIGLSATLSNYDVAKDWISGNTSLPVSVLESDQKQKYNVIVKYLDLPPKGTDERKVVMTNYFNSLYRDCLDINCIVFANERGSVENTAKGLMLIAEKKPRPLNICVHHSSISRENKKIAEEKMKDPTIKTVTIASSTLELGIDVGDLDRIIHIRSPHSVSSFLQKIGRSGRRSGLSEMICYANNKYDSPIKDIEFDLIKIIAEYNLGIKKHWVEDSSFSQMPFSLLFQQIIATVNMYGSSTKSDLISLVRDSFPFRNISNSDVELLINDLCEKDILVFDEDYRVYSIGERGEKITGRIDFGSNFTVKTEYDVYYKGQKVGSIQKIPPVGGLIQLAGSTWIVVELNGNMINVDRIKASTETHWSSGIGGTSTILIREMYECLRSNEQYDFLDDSAKMTLERCRITFCKLHLEDPIVRIGDKTCFLPWVGTVEFNTISRILVLYGMVRSIKPPYLIELNKEFTYTQIQTVINDFYSNHILFELANNEDVKDFSTESKYGEFIPFELMKKQFVSDCIVKDVKNLLPPL